MASRENKSLSETSALLRVMENPVKIYMDVQPSVKVNIAVELLPLLNATASSWLLGSMTIVNRCKTPFPPID